MYFDNSCTAVDGSISCVAIERGAVTIVGPPHAGAAMLQTKEAVYLFVLKKLLRLCLPCASNTEPGHIGFGIASIIVSNVKGDSLVVVFVSSSILVFELVVALFWALSWS